MSGIVNHAIGDSYVNVACSAGSGPHVGSLQQYPSLESGTPPTGSVRFNGTTFEVFANGYWQIIPASTLFVSTSQTTKDTLDWARRKMQEEEKIKKLASESPSIAKLVEEINEKQKQLEMVIALIS